MARLECTVAHMGFPAATLNKRIKKIESVYQNKLRTILSILDHGWVIDHANQFLLNVNWDKEMTRIKIIKNVIQRD
jgi:ubiquinone biosynthesis protein Coq4